MVAGSGGSAGRLAEGGTRKSSSSITGRDAGISRQRSMEEPEEEEKMVVRRVMGLVRSRRREGKTRIEALGS